LIVAGYMGWMLYSAVFVLQHYVALPGASMTASSAALYSASGVFAMLAGKFAKERAPIVYYLYAAFPCFFWGQVASARAQFKTASLTRRNVVFFAFVLAAMELCVVGYFRRAAWSVGLVLIGVVWPLVAFSPEFMQQNRGAGAAWTVSCLITAVFPVLPVEKGESLPLM
jgi:phosphatidylinositol glycan class N